MIPTMILDLEFSCEKFPSTNSPYIIKHTEREEVLTLYLEFLGARCTPLQKQREQYLVVEQPAAGQTEQHCFFSKP